ncbi:hypothetical protein O6H91_14G037500 [Diphasiastrum complanatum]|uniref:Uncharacterized protein n=1 Tax=Diphasiastrum complanatum TaxID=34168 RepID=A0ACC2BN78_DIPCM|nr:hypothetical protein O6H91_14G037500 [Diphasiastrum complanatum]
MDQTHGRKRTFLEKIRARLSCYAHELTDMYARTKCLPRKTSVLPSIRPCSSSKVASESANTSPATCSKEAPANKTSNALQHPCAENFTPEPATYSIPVPAESTRHPPSYPSAERTSLLSRRPQSIAESKHGWVLSEGDIEINEDESEKALLNGSSKCIWTLHTIHEDTEYDH